MPGRKKTSRAPKRGSASAYKKAASKMRAMFGKPIGEGRLRIVFRSADGDALKIPKDLRGEDANYFEASTWDQPYEPRAHAEIDNALTKQLGVPVLRMEHVTHVGWSTEPDWTWSVDCGQVGYTRTGRLVAYDWDRF